ncbi:MAG: FeoA family protein [Acidobacteria bacterium]|nr:FeoA family protein [Acidobacteriota bacterium]
MPGAKREFSPSTSWRPLTQVAEGTVALLRDSNVPADDQALLRALGLVPDRRLVVCKTGAPWIVEVLGARIGLSESIAELLLVEPIDEPLGRP